MLWKCSCCHKLQILAIKSFVSVQTVSVIGHRCRRDSLGGRQQAFKLVLKIWHGLGSLALYHPSILRESIYFERFFKTVKSVGPLQKEQEEGQWKWPMGNSSLGESFCKRGLFSYASLPRGLPFWGKRMKGSVYFVNISQCKNNISRNADAAKSLSWPMGPKS